MLTKTDLNNIATLIKDVVPAIIYDVVPPMIRTEIEPLRQELARHSLAIRSLQVDMTSLKQAVRHQGVLYEELSGRIDTALELIADTLSVKTQVRNHEQRISKLERRTT